MPAVPVRRLPFTLTETSVLAIIPARYHSTRLPAKALADLGGQPMVVRVLDRARQARLVDAALVATDDSRIVEAVEAAGGHAVLTRADHPSATDRIAEVVGDTPCRLVVNVQGDEPLLEPDAIDAAIQPVLDDPSVAMSTIARPLRSGEYTDPNVVKVVRRLDGRALYFSRAPIPYYRDGQAPATGAAVSPEVLAHIGLYAYRRDTLLRLASLPPSALERAESLEQLRALEHGIDITVVATHHDGIGVDTPEDLERVRQRLLATAERR